MAKRVSKEEREQKREKEAKKQKTKKIVYICAFCVALIVGAIFTIQTFNNIKELGNIQDPIDTQIETEPTKQPDIVYDSIQNGKVIVYNPKSNVKITRSSSELESKASVTVDTQTKSFIDIVPEESDAFGSLTLSGNTYVCNLKSDSKIDDMFTFYPQGEQSNETIYTLYQKDERIELIAQNMDNAMLEFNGTARIDINNGTFQISFIVGDKTFKIHGSTEEYGMINIIWDNSFSYFRVVSTVSINSLTLEMQNDTNEPIYLNSDDVSYGAMFDMLDTLEPIVRPKTQPTQ